jgi:DNA-binding NarL/FixJ family response regulator
MIKTEVTMCAEEALEAGTTPKLGILIVDDAEEVRRDLRTVLQLVPDLEILGEAMSGVEALALARELKPDIVLMDLRLPGLDGFEATEHIKRHGLAKRVIILTIYGQEEYRARAARVGADAFVEKGTDIKVLLAAIRQIGQSCMDEAGSPIEACQKTGD